MLILVDTTEERFVPDNLKEYCRFVSGLEDLTGADFIITPLTIPSSNESLLRRHAEEGICVQRKTIGDFVQSLRDERIWFQLERMHKVTSRPYLLIIGDLKCNRDGKAIIDGRESDWEYSNIIAAEDWWEIRGGYGPRWLSREGLIYSWCYMWATRLENRNREDGWGKKVISRPIQQGIYEAPALQRTLLTFPGLGSEKAEAVYNRTVERCGDVPPTLTDVLLVLQEDKIPGIGKGIKEKLLRYVGWQPEDEQVGQL